MDFGRLTWVSACSYTVVTLINKKICLIKILKPHLAWRMGEKVTEMDVPWLWGVTVFYL